VESVFKKVACPIRGEGRPKTEERSRPGTSTPGRAGRPRFQKGGVSHTGEGTRPETEERSRPGRYRAFKKVACPIRGREQGRKRKSAAGAQPAWQATALSKRWRVPYGGGNKAGNGRAQPAWQATALSKRWRVPYHGGGNKAEPTRTNPQKPTHKNQPTKTNPQKPTHKNQPTKTNPRSLFCSAGCISLLLVVCA